MRGGGRDVFGQSGRSGDIILEPLLRVAIVGVGWTLAIEQLQGFHFFSRETFSVSVSVSVTNIFWWLTKL